MIRHEYRLDRFDPGGTKIVTADAALNSLGDAWLKFSGIEERFPVDWIDIKGGIPTIHFTLPQSIRFNDWICAGVDVWEYGAIREIYFLPSPGNKGLSD